MKTKYLVAAIVIGLAVFLASYASAQSPSFQWARRVASTTNTDFEPAIGLAIDSAANLYVTGWFDGTNDFGGVILTNRPGGGQDIFVAKYNSSGMLQWARRAGSNIPDRDGGRGIGLDDAGNVYVTGEFVGYADFDGIVLSGSTEKLFFLAKYDSDGMIEWVRQSVGARSHYGTGLAVDGAGNCHAVGYIDDFATIAFSPNTSLTNTNDGYGTFVVKYDSEGNALWARLISSPVQTYSTSVAVDGGGNIYVSGAFQGDLSIGNTNLTSTGVEDGYLAKFNGAGDFQWVRQMITTSFGGDPSGVTADVSGNVYVAGGFGNTNGDTICFSPSSCLTNIGGGLTGIGVGDAFLAKYEGGTGTPQWAIRHGGRNSDAYFGVTTDPQGYIFLGGGSGGTDALDGFTVVISKLNPAGVPQWTRSSTGTNWAVIASAPVIDSAGNCYVAGWYQTNAVFGTNVLIGTGYMDFFLTKVGNAPLPLVLGIRCEDSLPRLSLTGEIGIRFALEYTVALSVTNNWQIMFTNTLSASPFTHTDATAKATSTRFYRARLVP